MSETPIADEIAAELEVSPVQEDEALAEGAESDGDTAAA
jgi:hypothetical protein